MKSLLIPAAVVLMIAAFGSSCGGGSSAPATFCDTTCVKDSLLLTGDGPAAPFVRIGFKDCKPDSVNWGNRMLAKSKVTHIGTLTGKKVHINPTYVKTYFSDSAYVWLLFNDCNTGQGFAAKLKMGTIGKGETILEPYNGALNSIDPKFSVSDDLVAWTDRGNIMIEDKATGKQGLMTFGNELENFDYANIHASIDSVNITATRIWAKFKVGEKWEVKEKNITLGEVR
jgi:hypothetical protein